ncbi:hypothetical protein, partial [Enterobacter asburiae]|uniref:hypothetical protein n=1 Tax=Enterobacter asburiae TaxID=61645 RepID=UPI0032B01CFF
MQVHRHGRFSVSVNFVFVSPDGSACPESFWSAEARSVPFTLADQVVTGNDYRKLIRRRKASQEKMTMCTPGLTAPLAVAAKAVTSFLLKTSRRYVSRIRNGCCLKRVHFFESVRFNFPCRPELQDVLQI